ncbi:MULTISPECIES: hypothetical protein [Bacillati]|uniref:hypothetical protein n=1 Tax=Streptomycetaceae TaxID=2062 RepID=UPI001312210F|nr:hypothetical protein [Stenotrophomonas maltophilia]MBH1503348.1 hypothetical protein [Stenotrophomonas maltophilia]MBH1784026.1 hypothetical protein [Stenotrophomonas maltophilia]
MDSQLLQEIARAREIVAQPKAWAGPAATPWREALGKPKGHEFRAALTIDGVQLEGLFVKGYFKADGIGRVRDKLSLSLIHGARLVGLDEGGMGGHRCYTGAGRPYYGAKVGVPHLHTISDDAIEGYAEPLEVAPLEDLWKLFLSHANIIDAPALSLPVIQRPLL